MKYPPRRIVARSTNTTDAITPIKLRAVPEALNRARLYIHDQHGIKLPVVEPEYHLFSDDSDSVARSLTRGPSSANVEILRCVVEVDSDVVTAHGSEARPVISIRLGQTLGGWQPGGAQYDALLRVPADAIKHVLIDLFLDFSFTRADHLEYIFEEFVKVRGITAFFAEKARFIRHKGLSDSRYGPLHNESSYANFSSHCGSGTQRDLDRLVELWDEFALTDVFKGMSTRDVALTSLRRRRKVGGQLRPEGLEAALSPLGSGAYILCIFTPTLRTSRQLESEVRSAFGIKKPAVNRFAVLGAPGIWAAAEAKQRRRLLQERYVRLERFIIR
jgi:hypothetical protein